MGKFEKEKPGNAALYHLYLVRLYLGISTVSNITDETGTYILPWVSTGSSKVHPTIDWPYQVSIKERTPQQAAEIRSLGNWIINKPYTLYSYYFNKDNSELYFKERNQTFNIYTLSSDHLTQFNPKDLTIIQLLHSSKVIKAYFVEKLNLTSGCTFLFSYPE
eukprot:13352929-Ditylum_brightwellii.AAC.1